MTVQVLSDPEPRKPSVVEAMNAAMCEVEAVGKTGHNKQQDYNFRGVDAVVNALGPAFRKHCVLPVPRVSSLTRETVEVGKNRTLMALATVQVSYRFYGPAGDFVDTENVSGEAMDSGDKAISKAMSVAYRTTLIQTFALPTHQPDPDEQVYERAAASSEPQCIPAELAKDALDRLSMLPEEITDRFYTRLASQADLVNVRDLPDTEAWRQWLERTLAKAEAAAEGSPVGDSPSPTGEQDPGRPFEELAS